MHQPIATTNTIQCPAQAQRSNPVEIVHFLSESPKHLTSPAQQNEKTSSGKREQVWHGITPVNPL